MKKSISDYTLPIRYRRMLLCAALSLVCSALHAADSSRFRALSPATANLEHYQWRSRPLVIFAPSAQDTRYQKQIALLKQNPMALAERDIVVLSDTDPSQHGRLRAELDPQGFEVVLVGKDGGMKMREKEPITAEVLFSTIDNMPMQRIKQN